MKINYNLKIKNELNMDNLKDIVAKKLLKVILLSENNTSITLNNN